MNSLPKTLHQIYERILSEIDEDYQNEALACLKWLCCSRRPLSIFELADAAVLNLESGNPCDPEERFPDPYSVQEILGSLISVRSDTIQYSDSNWRLEVGAAAENVFISHFSVKEYLYSAALQESDLRRFAMDDRSANCFVAESCLTYILYHFNSGKGPSCRADLENFPLMLYACQFWYSHARASYFSRETRLSSLILKIFSSKPAFTSWLRIHRPDDTKLPPFELSECFSSPLYYASFLGLSDAMYHLLNADADINEATDQGFTALHGAAWGGFENAMLLLLEKGADIEAKSLVGETALSVASAQGHHNLVRLLVDHGANIEAADDNQLTALHIAAPKNHLGVVIELSKLEEFGGLIDRQDCLGRTALHLAALAGCAATAKPLLDLGADINIDDYDGCNLLHLTASDLAEGPDLGGKLSLMRYFIEKKLKLKATDKKKRTPLHHAASSGYIDMIELLCGEFDVNAQDVKGSTALHLAIEKDREATQNLLIEFGANLDIENNEGQTPMSLAWSKKALNWSAYKKDSSVKVHQGRHSACEVLRKIREEEDGPKVRNLFPLDIKHD